MDVDFHAGTELNPEFLIHALTGNWTIDSNSETNRKAETLSYDVQTVNGDSLGPILSGQWRLRGWMPPVSEWSGKATTFTNVYWCPVRSHQRGLMPHAVKQGYTPNGIRRAEPEQLVCDFDKSIADEDIDSDSGSDVDSLDSVSKLAKRNDSERDYYIQWRTRNYLRLMPNVVLFQIQGYFNPGSASNKVERAVFLCLLLTPIDEEGEEVKYQRVGIAEVPDIRDLGKDGWVEENVVSFDKSLSRWKKHSNIF